MRVCERILNFVQIINYKGDIRLCSWLRNNIVGSLSENTFEEIWQSDKYRNLIKKLADGDYSFCDIDACPYLAMNTINDHLVEIDDFPKYPDHLYLAYEQVCNYKCTVCTSHVADVHIEHNTAEKAYAVIEERLKPVLPHLKHISAHGRGELFASPHILNQLANWKPLAPKEECSVGLETNGSLFDEKHWKQIENLGQYNLRVAITVMSFDEYIYQTLSGVKYPISKIENSLRFVKKLREQGIINHLELATVVQERNFYTMPEFVRRCADEFGADSIRLRPYVQHGSGRPELDWFTDVRGKYHPYHEEYLEVMKDPIFKHPKVADWSGGRDSKTGDLPQKVLLQNEQTLRNYESQILGMMIVNDHVFDNLKKLLKQYKKQVVIFGSSIIALSMAKKLSETCKVKYILNLQSNGIWNGIQAVKIDEQPLPPP